MKGPLIKDRAVIIAEFAIETRRSSKALVLATFPYFDEKTFDVFVYEGLFKHGYDENLVAERIAAIGIPDSQEKLYELVQLKVHEIMMFTHFALEHKDNQKSDHAWLCLIMAIKTETALHAMFAANKGMGEFARVLKTKRASDGGRNRSKKYDPLKAALLKKLKETVEADGQKWQSAYLAANKLQDFALASAKELNIDISENSIQTRLQEWFNDLPERDTLFASKRTGNASKATAGAK